MFDVGVKNMSFTKLSVRRVLARSIIRFCASIQRNKYRLMQVKKQLLVCLFCSCLYAIKIQWMIYWTILCRTMIIWGIWQNWGKNQNQNNLSLFNIGMRDIVSVSQYWCPNYIYIELKMERWDEGNNHCKDTKTAMLDRSVWQAITFQAYVLS